MSIRQNQIPVLFVSIAVLWGIVDFFFIGGSIRAVTAFAAIAGILWTASERLSNRQTAVLAFVLVLSAVGYAANHFFVRNVSTVSVKVDGPESARVSVQKNGVDVVATVCSAGSTCALEGIPPFEYDFIVSAEGFRTHSERLRIVKSTKTYKTVVLSRDVRTSDYKRDRPDAIAEIRRKRVLLSESGAETAGRSVLWNFAGVDYYYETVPVFRLLSQDGSGSTATLFESPTETRLTYSDADGLLLAENGKTSVLFDLKTGMREFPTFPQGVEKVAELADGAVVTAVASGTVYAFDRKYGSVSKNPLYDDYVLLSGGRVMGLVTAGNAAKSSLHGFADSAKSRVLFDSGAWKRTVIFESEADYRYLFFENGKAVIETSDGDREFLENYE